MARKPLCDLKGGPQNALQTDDTGSDDHPDGTPGLVTSAQGQKIRAKLRRRKSSQLRKFYRRLKLTTEVDPLALFGFAVGLIPLIAGLWNFITPAKVTTKISDVTLLLEDHPLPNQPNTSVLRIALPIDLENTHSTKSVYITSMSAVVSIGGGEKSTFYWEDFVHTQRASQNPKELLRTHLEDAAMLEVPPGKAIHKEVLFAVDSGTPSNPLINATTQEELFPLLNAGEQLFIDVRIEAAGNVQIQRYKVEQPLTASKYLSDKRWTVAKIEPAKPQ